MGIERINAQQKECESWLSKKTTLYRQLSDEQKLACGLGVLCVFAILVGAAQSFIGDSDSKKYKTIRKVRYKRVRTSSSFESKADDEVSELSFKSGEERELEVC